jgi:hypothetical protein
MLIWGQPPSAVRQAKLGSPISFRIASASRYGNAIDTHKTPAAKRQKDAARDASRWASSAAAGARKKPPHQKTSLETPCSAPILRDFHNKLQASGSCPRAANTFENPPNPTIHALSPRSGPLLCTKSGHGLVDGLHSVENKCTYKRVIFVDGKNRRSTTGSFFDSFLSFSGWCGVRGSSGVTVLIARLERRASKGL